MHTHHPSTDAVTDAASLCELFQATARTHPDEIALRAPDGSVEITWTEYAERVRRITTGLATPGVRAGDTVGLMLSNRPEFHLVDMAVLHLGATPFSIYNTSSVDQVRFLFTNADNTVVVTEADDLDLVRNAGADQAYVVCVDGSSGALSLDDVESRKARGFNFEATWRSVTGDSVATIIYTSGTTGSPKGAEIEHRAVLASLCSGLELADLANGAQRGRLISSLPDAHVANRYFGHYLALTGGSSITTVRDLKTVAEALRLVRPPYAQSDAGLPGRPGADSGGIHRRWLAPHRRRRHD